MTNSRYRKGATFEYRIRDALHSYGYAVARGAGSKGSSKADLVAFSPHGRILLIQAKTNGIISASEWNRLLDVSSWIHGGVVIPIIASKDARGKIVMDEITGPRINRKPRENRVPFDWRCTCKPTHPDLSEE